VPRPPEPASAQLAIIHIMRRGIGRPPPPSVWLRMQVAHDLATPGPALQADLDEIEPIAA
jgi:hypothetical protein